MNTDYFLSLYESGLPDLVEQSLLHACETVAPISLLPTSMLPMGRILEADEQLRVFRSDEVRAYSGLRFSKGSIDYAFVCQDGVKKRLILAKVASDERKEQRRTHEKRYALRDALEYLRESCRDNLDAYHVEPCLYLVFGEHLRKRSLQF